MLLELRDLQVSYGDIHALEGVSLSVAEGELVSVIGANGAGKSSLLNCLMGIVPARGGSVTFQGKDVTSLPVHERARSGIRIVPERARVFPRLSVYENLLTGCYGIRNSVGIAGRLEWLYSLFPVLEERKSQLASTLSGGEQQMLAISRALMGSPRILLLDEPSLGLAPIVVDTLMETILQIRDGGMTVLLVEQNATQALEISDRGYILEAGRFIKSGSGPELAGDPEIIRAYLGG